MVSLVWLIISLCGTLPYLISGEIPRFTDAFYESVSGFTTTGSTVISNIESQSAGMLFWRALTQWFGGMGIIMFTLSFMKSFGIGGMQLFSAEVPGVTHERVSSRIQLVARNIWLIYLSLTALAVLLLFLGECPSLTVSVMPSPPCRRADSPPNRQDSLSGLPFIFTG